MMSIGCISALGQGNELIPAASILPYIKAANQIYATQQQKIIRFEEITQKQEAELYKITLALDQCISERKHNDQWQINANLQLAGQQSIISKQSTIIKIMAGLLAGAVTYTIYTQVAQKDESPPVIAIRF